MRLLPAGAALLFLTTSSLPGRAQQHVFLQYTPEDGLAQSQVRCMAQDAQGYLWFGTLGGASRFDGKEFRSFALQEGLPDPQVNALCAQPDGTLWMGAGNHLLRSDGQHHVEIALPPGAEGVRVQSIAALTDGHVVVGTDGGGVLIVRGGSVDHLPGARGGALANVRVVLGTKDGGCLLGTRKGLFHWRGDTVHEVSLGNDPPASISSVALGRDGSWWVGTFGDGLYHVMIDGTIRSYGEQDGLLQNNVRHVLVDDEGRVWVSSKFGVNLVPTDGTRMRAFTVNQGMPNDNIWCAYQDREGHLWLGTDGAGALRYTGDRFVTFTVRDGLCSDQVMCFVEDTLGALWMGTYGSGICRSDGMALISTYDGLPNNTVWCGTRDAVGRLWFGTSDGVCRIEQGRVVIPSGDASLAGLRVLSMLGAPDGTVWCGTREGLSRIGPDGSVTHYHGTTDGSGRSVRDLVMDGEGRLWAASDQGISVLDGGVFTRFTTRDGLADNTVFCMLIDERGRLWAGTANGLSYREANTFHTLRPGPDFGSNYIDLLTLDPGGDIWIGTNNGIYRLDPDGPGPGFERFGISDGLGALECNQNAVHRDGSGRLLFGTAGGVVRYDPARGAAHAHKAPPPLVITGLRWFLEPTDWTGRCDSIDPRSGLPSGLRLAYRRNHLTFDFAAITLADAGAVRYRYMLEGADSDWLPQTDGRSATFSNLTQGTYTFRVKAVGRNGLWSEPVSFTFSVRPPWWLSPWFFLACTLVAGGAAFAMYRYRSLVRRRHERTRHLMLRSRMLQLEQQALNANMNRHFIFNALNSIQYYINRQDRIAANRYLTSFAKLIRKNLDASQGDTTTLAEELERLELYLVLEHMRFKDRFRYELSVEEGVATAQVRLPAMMLQPYVENSIWHGILPMERQGTVRIRVEGKGPGRVQVRIEDDGLGVDRSLSRKGAAQGDHISRGIEITKGRADVLRNLSLTDIRIDGPRQIEVEGEVLGTQVIIELPCPTPEGSPDPDLHSTPDQLIFGKR